MAKNEIKRLNPKGAETKYIGFEPEWKFQPTSETRVSALPRPSNGTTITMVKKMPKKCCVNT